MLNLDDSPSAPVQAASHQLDVIGQFGRRLSGAPTVEGRVRMAEGLRPCYVALRWLNEQHFQNSPTIAANIDELERQVDALAAREPVPGARWESPRLATTECPVCEATITNRYCPTCCREVDAAFDRLTSAAEGFGTAVSSSAF